MIYEYRFYDVAHGRMAAEVARMYDVALKGGTDSMFAKYGVKLPLGAWVATAGRRLPLFGYIQQWDSLKQRDAAFPPFWADPVWAKMKAETDGGSPLVERMEDWLMRPAPCWAKVRTDDKPGPVHEMRVERVSNGHLPTAHALMGEVILPQYQVLGAVVLGVFDVLIGPNIPTLVTFLAWPDHETQQRAAARLDVEPRVLNGLKAARAKAGEPLFVDLQQHILQPVPWAVPAPNFGVAP